MIIEALDPEITSASTAPTAAAGAGITYTATATGPGSARGWSWVIVDDGTSGVTIDELTGVMSGGAGAAAGDYTIRIVCGGYHGRAPWSLGWTVTP